MIIGERLRALRDEKKFLQGDIEKKMGLLRCYVSRVEHGHTVPSVETLEKMARALEIPMYKLFYESEEPPKLPNLLKRKSAEDILWRSLSKDENMLAKFCRLFGRMKEGDRNVLFFMAQKMAKKKAV
jgi:transcriptional regulator with XRE-family HTH domain